jgi:hypothetical protein
MLEIMAVHENIPRFSPRLSAEAQTVGRVLYTVSNSGGDGVFYVYVLRRLRNDKRYVDGSTGTSRMRWISILEILLQLEKDSSIL